MRSERFEVWPGVYDTGPDTELLAECTSEIVGGRVLEIGCGCGAVTILASKRAAQAIGVDVNALAVANARRNAVLVGAENVRFVEGDVSDGGGAALDVVLCNPPYSDAMARDPIEQMFWDAQNEMKVKVFALCAKRLKRRGRLFFGWATFEGLEVQWPVERARAQGMRCVGVRERAASTGAFHYLLYEFELTSET